MGLNRAFWQGRKVLLTGHTGFKGGWLALWLRTLGAEVQGYALAPNTTPSLFDVAGLSGLLHSELADVRDAQALHACMQAFAPEVVFHLAAQPLVRASYQAPADTYAVNVMGTVHLLEAVRQCPSVKAVAVVTSDKCYANHEQGQRYQETDPLGGHDPYSSSKACVELLCASWRDAFLREQGIALATARAGNVIGGGDWSLDRLVPDILRVWQAGQTLTVRYPKAVRPWQHTLEPLCGYLQLAEALHQRGDSVARAWNFGPDDSAVISVAELVEQMAALWSGPAHWQVEAESQPHEATLLALDSSPARAQLAWQPRWSLSQALEHTLAWHAAWQDGADMQVFSRQQIATYEAML